MQVVPDGIPDKARADPAIGQSHGPDYIKKAPSNRIARDDGLDARCIVHCRSLAMHLRFLKVGIGPESGIQTETLSGADQADAALVALAPRGA